MKSKQDQKKKKAPARAALGASVAAGQAGALSQEAALFRHEQINLLAKSGWNSSRSICEGLKKVNLPAPTAGYLESAFSSEQWAQAYHATTALRDHCKNARYADQAIFGVLLVPDPNKLDTRGGVDPAIRCDQTKISAADIVDKRLPAGNLVTKAGIDWTLVATITGSAGIFLGSYNDIRNDESADAYTIDDVDTRNLMVRQIWGARVLQNGNELPDSDARVSWTFTVFPGEELTEGCAPSGTVLFGRVRFRLGRPDRRISVVRDCPSIVIA